MVMIVAMMIDGGGDVMVLVMLSNCDDFGGDGDRWW